MNRTSLTSIMGLYSMLGVSPSIRFPGIPVYRPSPVELRSDAEHQRRKDAAETKRQRKAKKLQEAVQKGGIKGKTATMVIVDDMGIDLASGPDETVVVMR